MSATSILLSAGAAALFALLYQCAWRSVAVAALVAAVAWALFLVVSAGPHRAVLGDAAGALTASLVGELAARWRHEPASVFVVPAIIPLVPGYTAYEAMRALVAGHFLLGIEQATGALLVAGALAVGIAFGTAVWRSINPVRRPPA